MYKIFCVCKILCAREQQAPGGGGLLCIKHFVCKILCAREQLAPGGGRGRGRAAAASAALSGEALVVGPVGVFCALDVRRSRC